MSDNLVDPLVILLRRHEAANSTYDAAADRDAPEAGRNHLFAACSRTMQAVVDGTPNATTAEGAGAALDHVLNDESLSHNPEQYGRRSVPSPARCGRAGLHRTEREIIVSRPQLEAEPVGCNHD